MIFRRILALGAIALAALALPLHAQTAPPAAAPIITNQARFLPVVAKNGMVATQEKRATRVGVEILKSGGNAVDAAVAVGFALAVTHPQAGNIGGGGFMLVHLSSRNETIAIDYRETAPAAMERNVFLDDRGEADPKKSRDSALGVGVPGTVAGLALAHEKYGSGKFTLAQLIAPAMRLAREGFTVEDDLADSLPRAQPRLARWPATAAIFLKDGKPLQRGDTLVQADLAASLETIAARGPRAFYEGPLAEKLVASLSASGGIMTLDDLKNYRAIERPPVRGIYHGYNVASMPPPSSGGVHLAQILNILEGFPLRETGAGSAATLHLMIEAMKPAYADRAEFLGDPAFGKVPVAGLTSKRYAAEQRKAIDPERARSAQSIRAGAPATYESGNTTHYSVVDAQGNAVANTYSLNFSYGLGLVAEGTGILLNNVLDDFAAKPGVPNAYGLVGGDANAPGGGKRPLSSMSPTIVTRDGRVVLVTGTPGGSRIITTVLQVILNVVDHQMNIAEAVAAPRVHHQWVPDIVFIERGLSPDTIRLLESKGHKLVTAATSGSANSILVTTERLTGTADPRQRGTLAEGY